MKKPLRIILYGNSIVLAGVRLKLETDPAFEILPLDVSFANGEGLPGEQELVALHPDIILFDTSSVQPQFQYNLKAMESELQLIGIDPDKDQVLVWSGQHLHELSVQDLVSVMQGKSYGNGDAVRC